LNSFNFKFCLNLKFNLKIIFFTDFISDDGDTFYNFFLNTTEVNSYSGKGSFRLKEIDCNSTSESNRTNLDYLLKLVNQNNAINFTVNFYTRIFSSSCYYLNTLNFEWVSNGTQVMEDSTVKKTHCRTNHLTAFAPGFTGLPTAKIDFNYVFTHSSFQQNPTIYATVIVVCCSYIILAIIAFYFDLRDRNKIGISIIDNNYDSSNPNKYIYEIIVFTGGRKDAQTSSRVLNFLIFKFKTYK